MCVLNALRDNKTHLEIVHKIFPRPANGKQIWQHPALNETKKRFSTDGIKQMERFMSKKNYINMQPARFVRAASRKQNETIV